MDKHRQYQEDIVSYLMGELDDASRSALERHLASCPACRRRVQACRRLLESAAETPEIEPPADFTQRVMSAARAAQRRHTYHEQLRQAARVPQPVDTPLILRKTLSYRLARLVVFASVFIIALITISSMFDQPRQPNQPGRHQPADIRPGDDSAAAPYDAAEGTAVDTTAVAAIDAAAEPPTVVDAPPSVDDIASLHIEVPPLTLDLPPIELARPGSAIEELHVLRTNAPNPAYIARLDWRVKKRAVGYEAAFAIRRGLWWLANNQQPDGRWTASDSLRPGSSEIERGKTLSDEGVTAAALLAMLGDGHTPRNGSFRAHVARGVQWLRSRQQPDGSIGNSENTTPELFIVGQALATAALAETYGITGESRYLASAQRAADRLAQYEPKIAASGGSIARKQIAPAALRMAALATVRLARVDNHEETVSKTAKAFAKAASSSTALAYPLEGTSAPPITAGMLSMLAPGSAPDTAALAGEVPRLRQHLPDWSRNGQVYWLCGTAIAHKAGGDFWQQWNQALVQTLVRHQQKSGADGGSWSPKDRDTRLGGRVLATALAILALETPYR